MSKLNIPQMSENHTNTQHAAHTHINKREKKKHTIYSFIAYYGGGAAEAKIALTTDANKNS